MNSSEFFAWMHRPARGVAVVWLVDPEGRDVRVYRPGQDPLLVQEGQELTGDPVLPDFRCRVADFFAAPAT